MELVGWGKRACPQHKVEQVLGRCGHLEKAHNGMGGRGGGLPEAPGWCTHVAGLGHDDMTLLQMKGK